MKWDFSLPFFQFFFPSFFLFFKNIDEKSSSFLSFFLSKYSDEILTRSAREFENCFIGGKKGIIVDYSFSLVSKYQKREREISRGFDNVF